MKIIIKKIFFIFEIFALKIKYIFVSHFTSSEYRDINVIDNDLNYAFTLNYKTCVVPFKSCINNIIFLSLIVPAYNEEKNIDKCLTSLVNQKTKYVYEIIVIDNASEDNTPFLLKKYEAVPFIKIITITHNEGGSVARNMGITYSRGKYIGFIDADDEVKDNFVELLCKTAEDEDADVVKCAYCLDYNGNLIPKTLGKVLFYNYENRAELLKLDGYIWDAIYKRDLWNSVRFPEKCWYEDIIIKLIIFRLANKIVYIPDALYNYYINPNSTSKKQNKNSQAKCLEQFYLTREFVSYSKCELNLEPDIYLYRELLHELGDILYMRTKYLMENHRKKVFALSRELLLSNNRDEYSKKLDKNEFRINESFINNNFKQWEVSCKIKLLENKIK